jgi:hypothetical protein
VKAPSYRNAATNDPENSRAHRPSFEPPLHMREQYLQEEMDGSKESNMDAESSHPKEAWVWIPEKCIPQALVAPRYIIKTTRIGEHTQFMRDHALIGKFLGLWPSEKDLARWIKVWWNPKGDYELQLSSKGFFTVIFYNLEDKDQIFEGGLYFYNSVGLYLGFWTDRFCPEKENFAYTPVWIHLYSLPQEFWLEEILMGLGNTLGNYVKSSEATKQRKYTSYARICVYMNISKALPGTVTLEYQDEEWTQTIDYEHIPFRCRKFHEHGHLFRDFPLNAPPPPKGKLKKNQRKDSPRFQIEENKLRRSPQPSMEKRTRITTHLNPLTIFQRQKRWKTPTRMQERSQQAQGRSVVSRASDSSKSSRPTCLPSLRKRTRKRRRHSHGNG